MEVSERHVGKMSVRVFGVAGVYRPFPKKEASREEVC